PRKPGAPRGKERPRKTSIHLRRQSSQPGQARPVMSDFVLPPLSALIRRRSIMVVLALGLTLRIVLAIVPAITHYTGDSSGYIDPGVNLFLHASFAMTCDPRCVPTLWRTPGYPVILGILFGVMKMPAGALYALQTSFDTVTTLLIAAVAWGMGGPRAG